MNASAIKTASRERGLSAKKEGKDDGRAKESQRRESEPLADLVQRVSWAGDRPSMEGMAGGLAAMPLAGRQSALRSLQRTKGNGFVQRLAVQAKLTVGAVGDRYEQEADRVAEQVMRRIESPEHVQRQETEEEEIQAKPLATSITPRVQCYSDFNRAPGKQQYDYKVVYGDNQRIIDDFGDYHIKFHKFKGLGVFDEFHIAFEQQPRGIGYFFYDDRGNISRDKSSGLKEARMEGRLGTYIEAADTEARWFLRQIVPVPDREVEQALRQKERAEEEARIRQERESRLTEEERRARANASASRFGAGTKYVPPHLRRKPLPSRLNPAVQLEAVLEKEGQTKPVAQRFGKDSFQVDDSLEQQLASSRASGRPLPDSLRGKMEVGFGADFSGVRIHTGDEAAQLNRAVSAQAFTHGSDIFLGEGMYNPYSIGGKRLLAHELVHVVQQSSTVVHREPTSNASSVAPTLVVPTIQRLSWQNTRWGDATEARASGGGARGVIFVKDNTPDDPLVIKSQETAVQEVKLAAKLHQALWDKTRETSKNSKEWSISTPSVRSVSLEEAKQMKDALSRPNIVKDDRNGKARNIISNIVISKPDRTATSETTTDESTTDESTTDESTTDESTTDESTREKTSTLVFQFASGKQFSDILKSERDTSSDSPLIKMLNDRGYIQSLGKITVVDIFLGNWDRILGRVTQPINPENWKVDVAERKIQLIDNAQMSLKPGSEWQDNELPKMLAKNQFREIAQRAIGRFYYSDTSMVDMGLTSRIERSYKGGFDNWIRDHSEQLIEWFADGLQAGKYWLLRSLQSPDRLVWIAMPEKWENNRDQVREFIQDRLIFLQSGK